MLRRNAIFFLISFFFGIFFSTPDRAQREQPIGGLKKCVRARVRSAWRVEVKIISESANFGMFALITAPGRPLANLAVGVPAPLRRMLHEETCWAILHMYNHCGLAPEIISAYVRTRTHPVVTFAVYRALARFEETHGRGAR